MFKNLEIYKNNDVKARIAGGPGGGGSHSELNSNRNGVRFKELLNL